MTLRPRTAVHVVVTGFVASLLVWAEPAVAVTAPKTLADQVPVQAGPVEPGFPIGYVGVIWETDSGHDDVAAHPAPEPHGAVRFRHEAVWGPWIPLTEDGVEGPGQWASGLVAGDRADAYQVRGIPAGVGDARAVAINTTDGPAITVGVRPGGAAHAIDSAMCRSRADWGADEDLRKHADGSQVWTPTYYPAQVMTVHHTATQNGDPDPAATVRAIYRYHAVDQGWGDIGYQYLIDESGVVYEGRWSGGPDPDDPDKEQGSLSCVDDAGDGSDFGHEEGSDLMVTGAHTGGWNSGNLGVALLGEFTEHRRSGAHPQATAVDAAEDLLAELAVRHGLDPLAQVTYTNPVSTEVKAVETIAGHRDYTATECPGQRLYDLLPTIRQDVAAKMAVPADGAPAVTVTNPDGSTPVSGTVTVTADASDDGGVTRIEFSVGSTVLGADTDGKDGWSTSWDTTSATDGEHTVTAVATDTTDQSASDSVTVTVDNSGDGTTSTPLHVGDLDGVTRSQKSQWQATVTVTVVAQDPGGATVNGTWTATGTVASCTTAADGTCSLGSPLTPRTTELLTFRVDDVVHPHLTYDPTGNTDPDGDSDGTTITIAKAG